MRKILGPRFFSRPATEVAPALLGKYLVLRHRRVEAARMITETEAYHGEDDLACHASKGRTKRTAVMFGPPGRWYVYFIYGMYEMLNIVTGPGSYPSAVLIRGVEGFDGPGKLTRGLMIRGTINAKIAGKATGVWIEDRGMRPLKIKRGPRVGVAYAGKWAKKPWRFQLIEASMRRPAVRRSH